MAPVAAHLCLGVRPDQLGPRHAKLVALDWPEVKASPGALIGHVLNVDGFGNLITTIERAMLPSSLRPDQLAIHCQGTGCGAIVETYGQTATGQLMALFGSADRLEIAVNQGSAAKRLGADVDDEVHVTWTPLGCGD